MRDMPHTYSNLLYHLVFSTKGRYPFITRNVKSRLYAYIGGSVRGLGGVCLEIGGVADHVHLLVKLKPTTDVAEFLQKLKPNVTHWARRTIHPKFEWQNGYGAFTVSESQIEKAKTYLQNQEFHHLKFSFEDEFKMLLRKSGIDFDERFLGR
jgi:putative transposase